MSNEYIMDCLQDMDILYIVIERWRGMARESLYWKLELYADTHTRRVDTHVCICNQIECVIFLFYNTFDIEMHFKA